MKEKRQREESGTESYGPAIPAAADSIHKGQSDPAAVHWVYLVFVAFPVLLVVSGPGGWVLRMLRARRSRR